MRTNSYVYRHVNKKNREIFYIGIGTENKNGKSRAYSYNNRNRIWHNYIKKHGDFDVEFIKTNITRIEACEIEQKLIKEFGRIIDGSGRLANISFGGERTFYGMVRTKEHTQKIVNKLIGKKASLQTRKKQSDAKKGNTYRRGAKLSIEAKAKISKANKGSVGYWTGKKRSDEDRLKMKFAKIGKKQSEEHIEKRVARLKGNKCGLGKKKSDDFKEKARIKMLGNKYTLGIKPSQETKNKMSDSQRKRWQKIKKQKNEVFR